MPLSQSTLTDALGKLATADPAPAGLTAAAMGCALAASLVERVSSESGSPLAVARVARSSALRERLLALVDRDGVPGGGTPATPARDTSPQNGAEAEFSAESIPASLAIASCAAQLTGLAAECAAGESDVVVSEAIVAAELADGACRAAAHILRIVMRDSPQDPRRTEVTGMVNASSESLQEAFAEAIERQR